MLIVKIRVRVTLVNSYSSLDPAAKLYARKRSLSEVSVDDTERSDFPGKPNASIRVMAPKEGGWLENAIGRGISVVSHISASTPSNLCVVENLLYYLVMEEGIKGAAVELPCLSVDDTKALAGVLLIPQLERGNFHSLAETGAAVHHYLADLEGDIKTKLSAKESEIFALQCMALGVGVEREKADAILSFEDAAEEFEQVLESRFSGK